MIKDRIYNVAVFALGVIIDCIYVLSGKGNEDLEM